MKFIVGKDITNNIEVQFDTTGVMSINALTGKMAVKDITEAIKMLKTLNDSLVALEINYLVGKDK